MDATDIQLKQNEINKTKVYVYRKTISRACRM